MILRRPTSALNAFTYYVGALVNGGTLTHEQGDDLLQAAESIIASMG